MQTLVVINFYQSNGKFCVEATEEFNAVVLASPDCDLSRIILVDFESKIARWRDIEWRIESIKQEPDDAMCESYRLVLI